MRVTATSNLLHGYGAQERVRFSAGGHCSNWKETDQVTNAEQSGTCGDWVVPSIYASEADVHSTVVAMKQIFGGGVPVPVLEGKNWIVNADNPSQYLKALGGTVVNSH